MRQIALFGKRGSGKFAFVSDDDFVFVSQSRWRVNAQGYVVRSVSKGGTKSVQYLHILIAARNGIQNVGQQLDHANCNKLDNTRDNLRLATRQQNQANRGRPANNTSGFKGVSWNKQRGQFVANITVSKKTIYLGYFAEAADAHAAYARAAIRYFGEYARSQ